jgi:hypothetical protein
LAQVQRIDVAGVAGRAAPPILRAMWPGAAAELVRLQRKLAAR